MKSCWSWIRLLTKQEQGGHLEDIYNATLTQSTQKFLIANPMTSQPNLQGETQQTGQPTLIWTQYWSLDISHLEKNLQQQLEDVAASISADLQLNGGNSMLLSKRRSLITTSNWPRVLCTRSLRDLASLSLSLSLSFYRCDFNKVTPADNKSQLPNAICTSRTVSRSRCDLARHSLQRSKAWDRQACCWRRQSMRP